MHTKHTGQEHYNIMKNKPDQMDYDGMGNYGRFPASSNKYNKTDNKWLDVIMIIAAFSIPMIYYIFK